MHSNELEIMDTGTRETRRFATYLNFFLDIDIYGSLQNGIDVERHEFIFPIVNFLFPARDVHVFHV